MPNIMLDELLDKMKEPQKLIKSDEIEYKKNIENIAKFVCESEEVRVILLAGPSGSGKTTTANLLSDEIKRRGMDSAVVSLDNFYYDASDERYPRLDDGSRDFESPFALDIDELLKTMARIVKGEPFSVPKYDFKVGGKVGKIDFPDFSHGCVIIEGIHGLNPILSDPFPKEKVKRVFVSVSTNIMQDGEVILSGRKLRFVRRLVRDSIYRASDAGRTIEMWENVLLGEDKYLYPYKSMADIRFDTFHNFEPAVMKRYAEQLLTGEICEMSPYAKIVASALAKIPAIDSDLVPEDSLIREFIPGGIYEHLY